MTAMYALGVIFILYAQFGGGDDSFFISGIVMILAGLIIQSGKAVIGTAPGPRSDFVSDYDRSVIGDAFSYGEKKTIFYSALENLRGGELNDALDDFRELRSRALSDKEQGVLGFYTAVCYNHMGYPTNAGHCAAEAVENDVNLPDSLLMAARNFMLAGSTGTAVEYYERLLPVAEEKMVFPFIYNEMGKLYITAEKPDKARRSFEKAISEGLDPTTAQGGMALVCLMEGNTDEACEWYRLAMISRISDIDGYKDYCGQICTAHGYPADFLETHLREKYTCAKAAAE